MKLARLAITSAASGMLAVSLSSIALADDATLNTTGPDSNNVVKIDNSSSVSETNNNDVTVVNVNSQEATSGDVSASKNTTVGGASSGNASNNNDTSTTVNINNPVENVGGVGGVGGEGGAGGNQPAGGKGGSVLGASTGGMGAGEATLPEVGAKFPVDVSALRAAWHPQTAAPTQKFASQTQGLERWAFVVATVLSLLGAAGTAWYGRRKERMS